MRILFCVVLILSALISHLNAINKDTLKKFFSDEEKYSLRDMHKILTDINSYTFIQYSESIFTVMGQGIDVKKWDVMIDGFVAFNSLNKETGTHLKTLKYNEFQIKDINKFEITTEGHSLFLRIVIEKPTDTKLNYIFSGTNVAFKLHSNTPDTPVAMSTYQRVSLQHYFNRRALENLKRKETTFIIHVTD